MGFLGRLLPIEGGLDRGHIFGAASNGLYSAKAAYEGLGPVWK